MNHLQNTNTETNYVTQRETNYIHVCEKIRSDFISIYRRKPLAQISRPITRLVHHGLATHCFEYVGMWILGPYYVEKISSSLVHSILLLNLRGICV
jgi:hypothetical protein